VIDRYSRQTLLAGIGEEGQKKLARSYVVIIGCGALGSIISTSLVRAGIGKVRVIDRDFIEYHNLHRQLLFDEEDVRNQLPKAIAAERHLRKVNSSIEVEGVVADVNYTNIERFVRGADLILDGLDNFETRYLINDVSLKYKIPWIYGAAISSLGVTRDIIPGETPCFRCVTPVPPSPERIPTCDTVGVLSSAPFVIGSLQSAEAIKILVGAENINRDFIFVDVWDRTFTRLKIGDSPRADCPACQGYYEFLEARSGTRTILLCGQNAVQVLNPIVERISFEELADRLKSVGEVTYNEFTLRFVVEGYEINLFLDGRAIIKNTNDETLARGLYAKYIGV